MPPKKNQRRGKGKYRGSSNQSGRSSRGNTRPIRGAATRGVSGSASGDQRTHLPLLGDHFENRHMLYYDSNFHHNSATGLLVCQYFRANDLYDPDATGVGHQPVGFDQAMLFWEQFCVFSSKISVMFMSNSNTPVRVGIFLNPDTTNPTSTTALMENGYLVSKVLFGASSTTAGGSAHTIGRLDFTFNAPRYFSSANKETYFANRDFTGTVASSPTEMAYFGIFTFDMAGNATYDIYYDVTISYDARFWEPRKIAPSLLHQALRSVVYPSHVDEFDFDVEDVKLEKEKQKDKETLPRSPENPAGCRALQPLPKPRTVTPRSGLRDVSPDSAELYLNLMKCGVSRSCARA